MYVPFNAFDAPVDSSGDITVLTSVVQGLIEAMKEQVETRQKDRISTLDMVDSCCAIMTQQLDVITDMQQQIDLLVQQLVEVRIRLCVLEATHTP